MRPTVITGVSDDSKLMQEEIFGPVTCVVPFKTEEEVRELFKNQPKYVAIYIIQQFIVIAKFKQYVQRRI